MANFLISLIIGAFIISLGAVLVTEQVDYFNTGYSTSIDDSNFTIYDNTTALSQVTDDLRDDLLAEEEVSTLESVASFFNTAFTVGKSIINGDALKVVVGMINNFVVLVGLPGQVAIIFIGIITILLIAAIIKVITGR